MRNVKSIIDVIPEYSIRNSENTKISYGDETEDIKIEEVQETASAYSISTEQLYQTKLGDLGFYSGPIDGNLSSSLSM